MTEPLRGEESIEIKAAPEAVWDLVSDVTKMGQWSPETVSCEWQDGATGAAVGARFRGRNRRGMMRWSNKPEVISAERPKEFAFKRPGPDGGVTWTFRLDPTGDGTRLTESWEQAKLPPAPMRVVMGLLFRGRDVHRDVRTTLERMKADAEK